MGKLSASTLAVVASFAPFLRWEGECLVWTGETFKNYATMRVRGERVRVHRMIYELATGESADGLLVCHTCDNPPCIRPDHLFLGTYSDNRRDAMSKGRIAALDALLNAPDPAVTVNDDGSCSPAPEVSREPDATLLAIAGLVNGYHNDGTTLSAAETLRAIADALGQALTAHTPSGAGRSPEPSADCPDCGDCRDVCPECRRVALALAARNAALADPSSSREEPPSRSDAGGGRAELAKMLREFRVPVDVAGSRMSWATEWPLDRLMCAAADALSSPPVADQGVRPEWRCFHCDEVFTDQAEAREHFGADEYKTPACRLSSSDVATLRELEAANTELRIENDRLDNDARLWHESEGERRRLQKGQDTSWFMFLDSLEGERLVLLERLAAAEGVREAPAEPQACGWQDISTAPWQGEFCIIWCPGNRCSYMVTRHGKDAPWRAAGSDSVIPRSPTHWHPPLAPPVALAPADKEQE